MSPVFVVQVDGVPISGVTDVSASFGIDQDSDACTVNGIGIDGAARNTLVAYVGGDLLFNGEVLEPHYDLPASAPYPNTLIGTGYMSRLSKKWGNGVYSYDTQTAGAVETNLIEKSGIDVSLHVVVDSGRNIGSVGNELWLRDGTPQGIDPNAGTQDVPLNLIRDLLKLDLYYIAARSNGAIYINAMATDTPVATIGQGSPLRSFSWRPGNPNEIKNKWLIKGFEDEGFAFVGSASATSIWLPAPFEFNADGFQSFLLESDIDCQAVADAYLAYWNRLIPECTFEVDGNLAIQPGTTVNFTVPKKGLASTDFFITQVTHKAGTSFTTSGTGIAI